MKECMDIYNDLVDIASEELLRFGMNASCRAKDVLHIAERVAMAGIVGEHLQKLYGVAANCLEAKTESNTSDSRSENDITDDNGGEECGDIDYETIIQSLRDASFGLHSERSLLGLWRFSTRQRKQRAFFRNAARHFDGQFGEGDTTTSSDVVNQYDWLAMFEDSSWPLVVDVGCDMGVSLLGLASLPHDDDDGQSSISNSDIEVGWNKHVEEEEKQKLHAY